MPRPGEPNTHHPDRPPSPRTGEGVDRRTFLLAGGLGLAGLAAGCGSTIRTTEPVANPDPPVPALDPAPRRTRVARASRPEKPNVLVILVDQWRQERWFPSPALYAMNTPNVARLARSGVNFTHHFTAANDCTPARSTLVTGLHTHQTGCMITGGSTLDPGFPTWGSMIREHGYRTTWFGKWHLTRGDNLWSPDDAWRMEAYGFDGGTYPSPDGGPGQGWKVDPHVAEQFVSWLGDYGDRGPWCTTVSFVNPHDIAWWYDWSNRFAAESWAPSLVQSLPPNFETPAELQERGKPTLQQSLQDTAAASFGAVPFTGPDVESAWLPFLDLYLRLQRNVDSHIGRVLRTLASRPEVAANTVILFTSDHGEYGASHGLRGKGGGAYDEAINVPLVVHDPRGVLTNAISVPRDQLSSSVDVAPLLLTIATGSNDWRSDSAYSHIADRLDLAAILADPAAAGRQYVLHATDETVTEFAIEPYAADAPLHVVALRTQEGKYATYSDWEPGSLDVAPTGQQEELYDYSTHSGRLELHNGAGSSRLQQPLSDLMTTAVNDELGASLPLRLAAAQQAGLADYAAVTARTQSHVDLARARDEAVAAVARSRRAERQALSAAREYGAASAPTDLAPAPARRSARRRKRRRRTHRQG